MTLDIKLHAADETESLRRCVRELAALSTLSAVWADKGVREIAEGLCRVICRSLPAALAYVRIGGSCCDIAVEAAANENGPLAENDTNQLAGAIDPALAPGNHELMPTIANLFTGGTLRLASTGLGYEGDCGLLVVGSEQPGFPSQIDRLLLGVGANQAAIVLQQRQRRREEEKLRESDRRYRERVDEAKAKLAAIVESSEDAIVSKNLDGIITSWNRGAEHIFGYTAEETIGQPVTMLMPPERVDEEPAILDRIRRGEKIAHYETIRRRKDGALLNISLSVSPVFDAQGNIIGASKIARDITHRKQAEQRLRLLWEAAAVLLSADNPDPMLRGLIAKIAPHLGVDVYFNYLVNDSGDALRLASCDGIPLEAARTMTRLEFGQSICGTVAFERRAIVVSQIQQSDDPEAESLKRFGIRAYVCNPLVAENRLVGTLSFGSRTKDHFDPEEVAFLETLCHYVTMAYERLRLLNELKEADRRKDEFLATLAHELRNPLAPVRNAVQVLRLRGPDEPELRWGWDVIDRQVEHLTRLIDDLLDISRITRNKLELRKQRVELAEVIRGAVESSRPVIEQRGQALEVLLPPGPIHLNGDLVRLTQVFLNLLNNAAKFTEPGGRIWLSAERQAGDVLVRVKDSGVGIAAEKLPRLFDIFFQVDKTREQSQGGLGIGLSLVRRLVELHGGRVEAHSEGVGKGSEFIVRLPALVEQPSQAQDPSDNGKPKLAARRILVVDDNRDSADSLAMLLRLIGNEVHAAYDGMQGVEAAEQFRPEVVLLDIGMPRLNGEDACRRIRAEPWGQEMMLIALTGWGQEGDRRRFKEAGFDHHMTKPVEPAVLLKLLAERQPMSV